MPENQVYDLIIIGAGPAGVCASIYAVRQSLKMLVLEGKGVGGQVLNTNKLENYPGFPKPISGAELAENMRKQLENLKVEVRLEEVTGLKCNDLKEVKTTGNKYKAKAVIMATGAEHRKLGIPGESKFAGKGVSYCSTCDAAFFKGKEVAVIGAGNTAVDSALLLEQIASKVYLIHRRQGFRADKMLLDILNKSSVNQILDTVCEKISGDKLVNGITIKNVKTNETNDLKVSGVFINVGETPMTELAKKAGVEIDESSYIKVNKEQETNVKGIFAAGDVTGHLRQIVTAVGEGAVAAISAYKYIKNTEQEVKK